VISCSFFMIYQRHIHIISYIILTLFHICLETCSRPCMGISEAIRSLLQGALILINIYKGIFVLHSLKINDKIIFQLSMIFSLSWETGSSCEFLIVCYSYIKRDIDTTSVSNKHMGDALCRQYDPLTYLKIFWSSV
jgi:hypothetical protein